MRIAASSGFTSGWGLGYYYCRRPNAPRVFEWNRTAPGFRYLFFGVAEKTTPLCAAFFFGSSPLCAFAYPVLVARKQQAQALCRIGIAGDSFFFERLAM